MDNPKNVPNPIGIFLEQMMINGYTMKIRISAASTGCVRILLLSGTILVLACNNSNSPNVRDRNNALDGDDTKQPRQDQDSVNRVLNEHHGRALDTLPTGLNEH